MKTLQRRSPDWHMVRIAIDTCKNPNRALWGGPDLDESKAILRRFGVRIPDERMSQ